eukprot:TRINITY_DN11264_c0_g1_i1.p1 TRINITY_DN11264_c0_g1~~TRINITY_DN11264_c0_g1_i1.p1  ORF type:complete len:784 (-),score=198.37 TRINITY_DN11264_c0_g1_i1:76-2427(-)
MARKVKRARKAVLEEADVDGDAVGVEEDGEHEGSDNENHEADSNDEAPESRKAAKKRKRKEKRKDKSANPAFSKTGWKPIELDLDVLKEFEAEGGLFFEECDPEEVGIDYLDPSRKVEAEPEPKKKKKKKTSTQKTGTEDLASENDRLRQELAKLKGKSEEQQEELAVAELSAWKEFELHPKILVGLSRLGFKAPTPVQARCLSPAIRQRKDVVGAAETGSGKTLAFGLPIIHHTLNALGNLTAGGSSSSAAGGQDGEKPARPTHPGPKGLVILPTRELAVQVQAHINAVCQGTPIHAECLVGGMALLKQKRLLNRHPLIVVGTPGRIYALMGLGEEADKCEWLRNGMKCVRHLVLDEADRLVESGHFKELTKILGVLYDGIERKQQLQTFVFSATLTLDPRMQNRRRRDDDEDEDGGKVEALMQRIKFREPRAVFTVDLTRAAEDNGDDENTAEVPTLGRAGSKLPDRLQFKELRCQDEKDKEGHLAMWLLRRYRWGTPVKPKGGGMDAAIKAVNDVGAAPVGGKLVLFVNAITSVMRLNSVLSLLLEAPSATKVLSKVKMGQSKGDSEMPGVVVDVLDLHSKMRQKDRLKRIERFKKLKHAVLVCTDIAARGLDVKDLGAVIHYQAPRGSEVFVHRSGRTARAGQEGESIAFLSPGDAQHWQKVYRAVGIEKERVEQIDVSAEELSAANEASKIAVELEKKAHQSSKQAAEKSWLKRAAEEAELMLDSDEEDRDKAKKAAPNHELWGLYRQLLARVRRPPRRVGTYRLGKKARLAIARRGK